MTTPPVEELENDCDCISEEHLAYNPNAKCEKHLAIFNKNKESRLEMEKLKRDIETTFGFFGGNSSGDLDSIQVVFDRDTKAWENLWKKYLPEDFCMEVSKQ